MYYPPQQPGDFTKPQYAPAQPQMGYGQPQVVYVQQQPGYPPGSTVVVVQNVPNTPGDDQFCNNADNGNIQVCGTVCEPGVQDVLSWVFCIVGFIFPITALCIPGSTCLCRGRTIVSKIGGGFSLAVLIITIVWIIVVIVVVSNNPYTNAPMLQ